MLHTDEKTIANLFSDNGYTTGMFGKWHLGDNAPHRPYERGFQDVVWHRCGGIGQVSDYWGNDYFDDTYDRNGKFEKFEGYCTDIWFSEATRFIEKNQEKPFFLYLATNVPHSPYRAGDQWVAPYQESADWKAGPEFYGMIANFDHNLGVFRKRLQALGLAENTIFVFMTDNGTARGAAFDKKGQLVKGFNAGMRGKKGSQYDGGHRVPFFIHWPAEGITGGVEIDKMAAHIDVLPTLAELSGISVPESYNLDGISFASLLKNPDAAAHRDHLFVQLHGGLGFIKEPEPFYNSTILTQRWRLMNGDRLYDIKADPGQQVDVASEHSEVVAELRELYMPWWESISPRMTPVRIDLGNPTDNPTVLCSQDWYLPTGNPPWNFGQIKKLPRVTGPWMVNIKKAGRYRLTLRQYPAEANKPVKAVRAKLQIAGQEMELPVEPGTKVVVFEMDLPAGPTELRTWLYDKKNRAGGAYFTEVELL